jgi:hypothetical protein
VKAAAGWSIGCDGRTVTCQRRRESWRLASSVTGSLLRAELSSMRNRSPHNQLAVILTLWVMRREPSVERGAWSVDGP